MKNEYTKVSLLSIKTALGCIYEEFKTPEKMDLAITLIQNLQAAVVYTDRQEKDACIKRAQELTKRCKAITRNGSNFMWEVEDVLSRITREA